MSETRLWVPQQEPPVLSESPASHRKSVLERRPRAPALSWRLLHGLILWGPRGHSLRRPQVALQDHSPEPHLQPQAQVSSKLS